MGGGQPQNNVRHNLIDKRFGIAGFLEFPLENVSESCSLVKIQAVFAPEFVNAAIQR